MRRSARTRCGLAAVAMAVPLTVGCSKSPSTTAEPTSTTVAAVNAGNTVTMKSAGTQFSYEPGDVTVKVRDALTWINKDETEHTVTAESGQSITFKSPTVRLDQTFVQTFDKPGKINYFCSIHGRDSMKGTITVTE